MWAFIKWLFENGMTIWDAPLEQFFALIQGIVQLALTLLFIWIGLKLLWKGIKGIL